MPKTRLGTRILRAMLRAERRELQDSGVCPTPNDFHDPNLPRPTFASDWREWVAFVHEESARPGSRASVLDRDLVY
jgi:hypothetical protein